jgi:hypothetical protein
VQNDYDQGSALLEKAPPHLCVKENPQFKYKDLCFAFDKDMHEIGLHAEGISGFVDADGKCHYPLTGKLEELTKQCKKSYELEKISSQMTLPFRNLQTRLVTGKASVNCTLGSIAVGWKLICNDS